MSSRETSMYCITTASTKLAFSGKVNLAKSLCLKYYHRNGTFITSRNEVVAKVIFLHLFVILFTGGGLPQCMLGYHPPEQTHIPPSPWSRPPGSRHLPRSRHPPEQTPLPRSRHHPPRADTSPEQTPPGADTPPDKTPAYGLRAAGTHPTGMHFCCQCYRGKFLKVCNLILNYLKYQTVANLEK